MRELYIQSGVQPDWTSNDLTVLAKGAVPPALGSSLASYWGSDGGLHVDFIDDVGHVQELHVHPGAMWAPTDLTQHAKGAIPAVSRSAMVAYGGNNGSQHIDFIDIHGHVRELYVQSGVQPDWTSNDLTVLAKGAVPPATGSSLAAYWGSDGSLHVDFIDAGAHVEELYVVTGGGWIAADITALTAFGGTLATGKAPVTPIAALPGSALTGYLGKDGSRHTDFFDAQGNVRELYFK